MTKISFLLAMALMILLSSISNSKPIDASKVVIALNCGSASEQVTTPEGNFKYVPDQGYVKGQSNGVDYHNDAHANQAEIKYSLDKQVYMFQRHTYNEMTYELPVRKGINTIIMKFAQMYFKSKGERVFNIKLGNKIVFENFDVIQKSGAKYAAHEEYLEIDVRPDGVYYKGVKVPQGYSNNKIKLSFSKGKADNPIVQAIIVYHESIENSPQAQFNLLKTKWNSQQQMLKAKKQQKQLRQMIQIQKKKQKIVIRNDQLVVEQQESKSQAPSAGHQKFGLIRNLLMGPIGIILWTIVFGYAFLFIRNNIFKIQNSIKVSKN